MKDKPKISYINYTNTVCKCLTHHKDNNFLWMTCFACFAGFTRSKLVQSGTTSFLATVVFSDHPLSNKMGKLLQTLDRYVGCSDGRGAVLEGIHSEVRKTFQEIIIIFVT